MLPRCVALLLTLTAAMVVPGMAAGQNASAADASFDYARLALPDVASRMQLTDEQRASVTRLLNQRAEAMAKAAPDRRDAILAESNEKLAALLTEEQRVKLAQLPSQHKLRFNFRQQKWPDVLDWFAKQADLSLVIDKVPSGTFNYTDTKSYTPTEAIDLLNSVLLTKGFALIRHERMLMCIDISSKVPDDLVPRVKLEDLDKYGRYELVSVMFQLGKKPAQTVLEEISPLFGPQGKGAALPQTKQLLVTETAGKMRAISILIDSIPEPKEPKKPEPKKPEKPKPKPELVVYPVHSIDPSAAVEVLKKLISGATFWADTKADQITANAAPDQHSAIKKVLDQMMANSAPDKQPRLETYPLAADYPPQLAEQLKLVAPDLQAVVDPEKRRLLVFAEPQVQKAVKENLAKLRVTAGEGSGTQVAVYRLRRASAKQVASILQSVVPQAQITADEQTQRIIARGTADEQRAIQQLVQQMDPPEGTVDALVLQVYTVPEPAPRDLVNTLKAVAPRANISLQANGRRLSIVATPRDHDLIRATISQLEQAEKAAEKSQLQVYSMTVEQRKRLDAVIGSLRSDMPGMRTIDTRSKGELMVWATPSQHEILRALIKSLEQDIPADRRPRLAVYTLQQGDLQSAQQTLANMYPDTKIVLDAKSGHLLVWALPEEHLGIQQVLQQIDLPPSHAGAPVLKLYDVPPMPVKDLLDSLKVVAPQAKMNLQADGQRLSVVATPTDQDRIASTLHELTAAAAAAEKGQLQVYSMPPDQRKRFDAVIGSVKTDMPGMRTVETGNQGELMIWATPSQHEILKTLITSLAHEVPEQQRPTLTAYSLKQGDLHSAQQVLANRYPDAKIVLDAKSGHLLVWARPEEHVGIGQILEQIDLPPSHAGAPVLRLYDVPQMPASELLDALRAVAPQAKLNLRADGQRLSVVASPDDQQLIAKAVEGLKTMDVSAGKNRMEIYAVTPDQRKRFDAVIDSLKQELPGIKIIRDARPGELAIWARDSQHKVLRQLIDSLRREVPKGEQLQVAGYPVATADPARVMEMLKELYPDAKILLDDSSSRLLVWATEATQTQIKQAIEQLDSPQKPGANKKTLMSYPVGDRDPNELVSVLQKLVPQMTLTADRQAREIVAWGRISDHEILDRTLAQFREGDPAKQRTMIVYPTGPRDPSRLRDLIQDIAPEANVVADDVGRNVAVWGTPDEHRAIGEAVRKIVGNVDRGSAHTLVVYSLDRTRAYDVRDILQQVVPGARLTAGWRSNQLLAWATPEEHKKLKAAVEQMESQSLADRGLVLELHKLDEEIADTARQVLRDALPEVQFVSGTDPDKMLVWARPNDHRAIDTILETLQAQVGGKQKKNLAVYTLDKIDQSTARQVLQESLRDLQYLDSGDPRKLLILATPTKHQRIKETLARLEQSAPEREPMTVQVYPLGEVDPSTVNQAIDPKLLEGVSVISDSLRNRLIVRTTEERQAEIKAALDKLLPELPPEEEPVSHVYRLQTSDPQAARTVIARLLPQATIAVDTVNRSLVVTAVPRDQELVQQTVDQMEKSGGEMPETRVYQFHNGDPQTAMNVLGRLLPDATLAVDARARTLAATARPADHEKIKATVDQMEKGGGETPETRIYQFHNGDPQTAMNVLGRLLPDAALAVDARSRTLAATARPADHEKIKATVDQMEKGGGETPETRIYQFHSGDPQTAMTVLQRLLPDAALAVDTRSRTLAATARPTDHLQIKATVDQMDRGDLKGQETHVYRLHVRDGYSVYGIQRGLEAVVPAATIGVDYSNGILIVTASPEDHKKIEAVIEKIDRTNEEGYETRVYRLVEGNPDAARRALERMLPDTTIEADSRNGTLIATASAEDHATIESLVKKMDLAGSEGYEARVYHLKEGDPYSVRAALQALLPKATISADRVNRSVIATASAKDHQQIKAVVEQMDRAGLEGYQTRVYRFHEGNPYSARTVLQSLLPDATLAADYRGSTLVATASAEDQEKIKAVVEEMDAPDVNEQTAKAYALQDADANMVYNVLRSLFRRDPEVGVSVDTQTNSVMVVADARKQATVEKMVKQMESSSALGGGAALQVYSLANVDSSAMLPALQRLLQREKPAVQLTVEPYSNSLMAVATPKQHEMIRQAISQLRTEERQMEVFQLELADPATVELAIGNLFIDDPTMPLVDVDPNTQRLFVRATQDQLKRIRELLVKMGEPAEPGAAGNRTMRVIPLSGDATDAVREIQRIWPQLRGNEIRVINPAQSQIPNRTIVPSPSPSPVPESEPRDDSTAARPADASPSDAPSTTSPDAVTDDGPPAAQPAAPKAPDASAGGLAPESPTPSQPPDTTTGHAGLAKPPATRAPKDATASGPSAPVIVIPGDGKLTIACRDPEALEQFESLLRVLLQRQTFGTSGNFAVYSLRNAGAAEVARSLTDLIRRLPYTSRGNMGRMSVVADERLNALIVYGGRADQKIIENLLKILDSSYVPDTMNTMRPVIVPVHNTEAFRILEILDSVYKTQLRTGSSRSRTSIPEGLPPRVAMVLRQINAAAAGPLLTLEVDETTNSIVVFAPAQLGKEVEQLIHQLDENALENSSRKINIIALEGMNTKQLQQALDRLSNQRSRGRYRGRSR